MDTWAKWRLRMPQSHNNGLCLNHPHWVRTPFIALGRSCQICCLHKEPFAYRSPQEQNSLWGILGWQTRYQSPSRFWFSVLHAQWLSYLAKIQRVCFSHYFHWIFHPFKSLVILYSIATQIRNIMEHSLPRTHLELSASSQHWGGVSSNENFYLSWPTHPKSCLEIQYWWWWSNSDANSCDPKSCTIYLLFSTFSILFSTFATHSVCWAAHGIFYILHGYSSLTLYRGEEKAAFMRDGSGRRTRDVIHIRRMGIGIYTKYIMWQSQLYRVTKPLIVTRMTDHHHVCDVTCHIRWQRHASNQATDTYVSSNSGELVPVPVIGYHRCTDRFNTIILKHSSCTIHLDIATSTCRPTRST